MYIQDTALIRAGIYYGFHKMADVWNLTIQEAASFLQRDLQDGENWSVYEISTGVNLRRKEWQPLIGTRDESPKIITPDKMITIGIYIESNCLAKAYGITFREAAVFLQRPLAAGQRWSIYHWESRQCLTWDQAMQRVNTV